MKGITLFLGDLYAGRFPIEVGSDPIPKGTIPSKQRRPTKLFMIAWGRLYLLATPIIPMVMSGWISEECCRFTAAPPPIPTDQGCISLASESAKDLYGILSQVLPLPSADDQRKQVRWQDSYILLASLDVE